MHPKVEAELGRHGTAQVACILHSKAAAGSLPTRLGAAVRAGASPAEALRGLLWGGLPGSLFLPHLGLVLGTLEAAQADAVHGHDAVAEVHPLTPLLKPRPPKPAPRAGLTEKAMKAFGAKTGAKARARAEMPPTWGLSRIGVPELWKRGLSGRGVEVAHLDSGVDASHPALKGKLASFHGFNEKGRPVETDPSDPEGHGTHTAGTILGSPVSELAIGVAPAALLHSARIAGDEHGVREILLATEWFLERRSRGANIRVLSMSLACEGDPPNLFDHWADKLRAAGILPVSSVGNGGPGDTETPGNCRAVLGVGALDKDDTVRQDSASAEFEEPSPHGKPDLIAPGDDVLSAWAGHDSGGELLTSDGGTSMATPHVAGIAALLFEARPTATVDEVEAAILGSCSPLEGVPPERQGKGVVSAIAALRSLLSAAAPTVKTRRPGAEAPVVTRSPRAEPS